MRLIDIRSGILKTVDIKVKNEYIGISHRWINNELNLEKLNISNLENNNINIGENLLNNLYDNSNDKIKKSINETIIENNTWNTYLYETIGTDRYKNY